MKDRLLNLRQIINNRLPLRWRLSSKVRQITTTISQLYEFNLPHSKPDPDEINKIRQTIILHPYTISTRPVRIKKAELENGQFELRISFVILNTEHGKQIENAIREKHFKNYRD
jgi:hypothetical protein